jgi:hypothetical protein
VVAYGNFVGIPAQVFNNLLRSQNNSFLASPAGISTSLRNSTINLALKALLIGFTGKRHLPLLLQYFHFPVLLLPANSTDFLSFLYYGLNPGTIAQAFSMSVTLFFHN